MEPKQQTKSTKPRSRTNPSVNLEDAIARARQLHEAEGFKTVALTVALGHWGYSTASGNAMRLASALKQYGLLDDEGSGDNRRVQLSERARVILKHPRDDAKLKAIREAAVEPIMYAELLENNPDGIPSDKELEWQLTKSGDLVESAVGPFIQNFRATLQLANLGANSIFEDTDEDNGSNGEGGDVLTPPPSKKDKGMIKYQGSEPIDWHFVLPESKVRSQLRLPDTATAEDIEYLREAINQTLNIFVAGVTGDMRAMKQVKPKQDED